MIINNMYNVTITSSNYNPDANTSITITATCKDFNGNAVIGKTLTIKKNGTTLHTGTTDSNGQISTSTTCGVCGAVNFSVDSWNCVVNVNPYPVGIIYISYTQSQNPSALFGGTWTQITSGFLYASTTADDVTSPPSGQGEETHKLSINEMPSHTHTLNTLKQHKSNSATLSSKHRSTWSNSKDAVEWENQMIANTGGGQAHNNMPPYIKVYMWKRTA